MRTQTSCFNLTALRKDLTRFAPLWGLYTLALLCGLFLLTGDNQWGDWYLADNFISLSQFMPLVNLGYAFLAAAALFGDLFNARMCNGLHALPLRREGWFAVHTLSGLLFSLIPTLVMALASLPMMLQSGVENAWTLSLYFFAYSNLQFLFFFATAVLAAQCVGNYVAMALMFLLINGGAVLIYILVDNLLPPLLYGVITPTDPFSFLSPVFYMSEEGHLFDTTYPTEPGNTFSFVLGDGWGYLLAAPLWAWLCWCWRACSTGGGIWKPPGTLPPSAGSTRWQPCALRWWAAACSTLSTALCAVSEGSPTTPWPSWA